MQPERPLRVAMIGLRGVPATYGGVERAVEELAAHLAARGHDITVYARSAYSEPGRTSYRGVQDQAAAADQHQAPRGGVAHDSGSAARACAGAGSTSSIFMRPVPARCQRCRDWCGVPVVVTIQGLDWRREKWGRGARAVLRLASRLAVVSPDRAIVVSRELERYYRDELDAATSYIPNGVDSRAGPAPPTR